MDDQYLFFRGFSEPRGARVSVWFEEGFGQGAFQNSIETGLV
jgi:hypothetical protein